MPKGHVDRTKLNPLSEHAWGVLERIAAQGDLGVGSHEFNAGVADRFLREGLIEDLPTLKRRRYVITAAGRRKLLERASGIR